MGDDRGGGGARVAGAAQEGRLHDLLLSIADKCCEEDYLVMLADRDHPDIQPHDLQIAVSISLSPRLQASTAAG